MIKNKRIRFIVLCVCFALFLVEERQYYRAHGHVSSGVIFSTVTLGVMAVASLLYGAVSALRRKSMRRR